MGAMLSRLVKPAARTGRVAVAAAIILWPVLMQPAAARGPDGIADVSSGQFGRVRLEGPPRRVLSVPAASVVRRGQLAFTFALDSNGAARLRMVSVGDANADRIEILAGLVEGDRVVVGPSAGLQDGQPIAGAVGEKR